MDIYIAHTHTARMSRKVLQFDFSSDIKLRMCSNKFPLSA
jgi:hypothetical protein